MLRKVKVQALLKHLLEERQQQLDLSADRVLQEIAKIAFFDPRKWNFCRAERVTHVE
jgi:phage terminase small subunit